MSPQDHRRSMFTTRSHSWREAGLARQLSRRAVKRARIQLVVVLPLLAGVLILYANRDSVFGSAYDQAVRAGTAVALLMLGWQIARDVGRGLRPVLFRRMDPGTAGAGGFLIPLVPMVVGGSTPPPGPGVTPLDIQRLLEETVKTPVRDRPRITLEEFDGDEVVVRIAAVPERASDGPKLASEVLAAVVREAAHTTTNGSGSAPAPDAGA